jgi:hypothetical protein
LLEKLKNRFKRKPDKKDLEQALKEALEDTGMADRDAIDQAAEN